MLNFVTDFGDSLLLSFIACALIFYMVSCRCRRAAWAMFAAWAGASVAVALLKLLFLQCAFVKGVHSPSGHAALAVAVGSVYGGLLAGKRGVVAALLFAAVIAWSRVVLGMHSVAEVLMGAGVGVVAALGAWAVFLRGHTLPPYRKDVLLAMAMVLAVALHGVRLPAELFIQQMAAELCPRE